jgi:hypothetical protein
MATRVPAGTLAGALAVLIAIAAVPTGASAAFHLMKVREVFPSPGDADFVELQMFDSGQHVVIGHPIQIYDADGAVTHTFPMPSNVGNGDSQRTVLIGDTTAAGAPDFIDSALDIPAAGGAVCFPDAVPKDCASWGNFNPLMGFPDPQTADAPAIPDGSSLTRSIAPGCSTLLESGDDTDNSASDFAATTPSPRNNSAAPSETACASPSPPDPPPPTPDPPPPPSPTLPPPPPDLIAPNTTIDRAPKGTIEKDKAKIAFSSNEAGSLFACRLDRAAFKPCTSPKTYRNLDDGKHKVLVQATDASLNTDLTPAIAKFKVDTG